MLDGQRFLANEVSPGNREARQGGVNGAPLLLLCVLSEMGQILN